MIKDVFKLIDQIRPFIDIINNNDRYIYLFDSFLQDIKYSEKNNPNITKAKSILNNIDTRNIYTSIGEYYLSNDGLDNNNNSQFDNFSVNTLIENRNIMDIELSPDDIRIKKEINCLGFGNNDPLINLLFYDNEFNTIKLKPEDVSKLLPNRFKSHIIRVFLTTKDKNKIESAQNALINYKNKYKGYAHLHKSEQKINLYRDFINKFEMDETSFKNNKDNFNKGPILGKKREKEKGYNIFHDQLFKKKK